MFEKFLLAGFLASLPSKSNSNRTSPMTRGGIMNRTKSFRGILLGWIGLIRPVWRRSGGGAALFWKRQGLEVARPFTRKPTIQTNGSGSSIVSSSLSIFGTQLIPRPAFSTISTPRGPPRNLGRPPPASGIGPLFRRIFPHPLPGVHVSRRLRSPPRPNDPGGVAALPAPSGISGIPKFRPFSLEREGSGPGLLFRSGQVVGEAGGGRRASRILSASIRSVPFWSGLTRIDPIRPMGTSGFGAGPDRPHGR